jgi:hypothetical protein
MLDSAMPRRSGLALRPGAGALAIAAMVAAGAGPSAAQVLTGKLLFQAVQPCRVFDTRFASPATQLSPGVPRAFHVVGSASNFAGQGGSAGGCSIPGYAGGAPRALAVALNVVAVGPTGPGHLRAWPSDRGAPTASVLNYASAAATGLNIANGIVLPLSQDGVEGNDLTLMAAVSGTHVLADVAGFFVTAEKRYYMTKTTHNGAGAIPACAPGFHMASLWEIFDTTSLTYDGALGFTQRDGGMGPPQYPDGWIRTGSFNTANPANPGSNNCLIWESSSATNFGSAVSLDSNWDGTPTPISPWKGVAVPCDQLLRVWCVEN